MKIEKINDRQIRCTLTKADLESRQIRLSELAYGSEKAKALFREMLIKAFRDFGFEVNNIPILIEAVPSGSDQLVLLVTKINDPSELEERFSRFTSNPGRGTENNMNFTDALSGADDILNLLKRFDQPDDKAGEKKEDTALEGLDKMIRRTSELLEGLGLGDEDQLRKLFREALTDENLAKRGFMAAGLASGMPTGTAPKPLDDLSLSDSDSRKTDSDEGSFREINDGSNVQAQGSAGRDDYDPLPFETGRDDDSVLPSGTGSDSDSSLPGSAGRNNDSAMSGSAGRNNGTVLPGGAGRNNGSVLPGNAGRNNGSALPGSAPGTKRTEAPRPGHIPAGYDQPLNPGTLTEEEIYQFTRFYLFRDLERVIKAARRIRENYQGENSLYKNPDDGAFYLLLKKQDTLPEDFNRICNIISEYSLPMDYASGMEEFFKEHMKLIIKGTAVQQLSAL